MTHIGLKPDRFRPTTDNPGAAVGSPLVAFLCCLPEHDYTGQVRDEDFGV